MRDPRRLQLVPQGGERHAEVVAPRARVRLRPEHVNQLLAGMGTLAKVSQTRQQSARLLGTEAGDDPLPLLNAQAPQQYNPGSCNHSLSPPPRHTWFPSKLEDLALPSLY